MLKPIFVISIVYIIIFLFVITKQDESRLSFSLISNLLGLEKKSKLGSFLLMQTFRAGENRIEVSRSYESYKWFGEFLNHILELKKKYGFVEESVFQSLKLGLRADIEQERLREETYAKGFFQLLLTSLTTIGFALYSMSLLELKIEIFIILLPLLMSLFATIVFAKFSSSVYLKMLGEYDFLIESCLKFKSLTSFRLPIETIIASSGVEGLCLHSWKDQFAEQRYEWFLSDIENWRKSGGDISPKILAIIDELFSLREIKFKRYNQSIQLAQFLLTIIVSLPIFFYTVYRILSSQVIDL